MDAILLVVCKNTRGDKTVFKQEPVHHQSRHSSVAIIPRMNDKKIEINEILPFNAIPLSNII